MVSPNFIVNTNRYSEVLQNLLHVLFRSRTENVCPGSLIECRINHRNNGSGQSQENYKRNSRLSKKPYCLHE